MLRMQIIFIGEDQQFTDTLEQIADKFQISLRKVQPQNNKITRIIGPAIVIHHQDSDKTPQTIPHKDCEGYVLQVLLVENNQTPVRPKPLAQYDDILIKQQNPALLAKKIEFYLAYLDSKSNLDCQNNHHSKSDAEKKLQQQLNRAIRQLDQAAIHMRLHTDVLNRIDSIRNLSRQINCLDLDQIASVCVESIPKLISARFASLYSFDHENQVLHLIRHNHPYTIDRLVMVGEHLESPMINALQRKKLLLISDLKLWKPDQNSVERLFTKNYKSNSCIIAPLLSGDRVIGILNLADKVDGPHFDAAADLPPIQLLCEMVGSAMTNIKLYEEVRQRSRTDGVTGLLNQSTFFSELERELSRAKRYGGDISLILIDLDKLKYLNDTYGHRAGDAAITHVANQIKNCLRDTDIAARYGGDEFAIILPNACIDEATIVAQRLVQFVANNSITYDQQTLNISVSVGLGQYQKDQSIEDFINAADFALFDAKAAGRNQLQIFTAQPS